MTVFQLYKQILIPVDNITFIKTSLAIQSTQTEQINLHMFVSFYLLLRISVIRFGHHQSEKRRYRRKRATK
jgi:hypothetical protein